MTDLEKAKELLTKGGYTCVLCKGDETYTSCQSGIVPMVGFLSSGVDLRGFSAADKIVGKAAALLFVLAGVCTVHANVLSETAQETLRYHGCKVSCDVLTKQIINRAGDGLCPMEQAVSDTEEPTEALEAVQRTLERLRAGKQK